MLEDLKQLAALVEHLPEIRGLVKRIATSAHDLAQYFDILDSALTTKRTTRASSKKPRRPARERVPEDVKCEDLPFISGLPSIYRWYAVAGRVVKYLNHGTAPPRWIMLQWCGSPKNPRVQVTDVHDHTKRLWISREDILARVVNATNPEHSNHD
jgi:hypothetical protein